MRLATGVFRPNAHIPTLVFVHGLDSAKDTWSGLIRDISQRYLDQVPIISLDLRGHGESELGNKEDFTPKQLSDDIRTTLLASGVLTDHGESQRKIVLVGHSMGGRVVTRYAAEYPGDIACLVVEDICMKKRKKSSEEESAINRRFRFSRLAKSKEEMVNSLLSFGYSKGRIEDWFKHGRIFKRLGSSDYWSNINPAAQYLARQNVLASDDGEKAWAEIAKQDFQFPIHLLIAPQGSAASEDGLNAMQSVMVKNCPERFFLTKFQSGGHSLHNTSRSQFLDIINQILITLVGK